MMTGTALVAGGCRLVVPKRPILLAGDGIVLPEQDAVDAL